MKKSHMLHVRFTESEFKMYKRRIKEFQKNLGIKLNTSEFVRLCIDNIDNPDFLVQIGYLSHSDIMDSLLFKRSKFRKSHR